MASAPVSVLTSDSKFLQKPFAVSYVKTFMDVPVGDLLMCVDSRGRRAQVFADQQNQTAGNAVCSTERRADQEMM